MIEANDVQQMLFNMLSIYNIPFERLDVGDSAIFEVELFGVKIIYLDGQLFDKKSLNGWHVAYVHLDYTIAKAREAVVWGLVKGGYFHYLRHKYTKTFKHMLVFEGWDKLMDKERKRLYKDMPRYNYIRDIMKGAEKEGSTYILSKDPGFFDFIVE